MLVIFHVQRLSSKHLLLSKGLLYNPSNMPSNFCFLVQAEFSLVIGGNCNASHFLATGRLPLSSEGQQWTNRQSLASFYDILLWCLVCSTLVKNYSRHDWRRISTKDVTAPFQFFSGSQLLSEFQTFLAGNQLQDWQTHRRGCGCGGQKKTLQFSAINSDF